MGIKSVFGLNLKYYRKRKKLSQEQLAEMLNISSKHLSTIETGAAFVSAELLEKMVNVLRISASALFYTIEEKSDDGSILNLVDQTIDKELANTAALIKIKIRHSIY